MTTTPAIIKIHEDIIPAIDDRTLLRYFGYPQVGTPDQRVLETLAEQRDMLPKMLQPRAIWGIFDGSACFPADFPLYNREVYLCVVTISDQLEKRVAQYAAAGDVLRGFLLDTLGSVCAENAAAVAYERCHTAATTDGLQVGCRISPGYGAWALAYQKNIFTLLPAEQIGIRLTSGLMMVPRKSVSFAAERAAEPLQLRNGDQCATCEMDHCRYRRNIQTA